jgi:hypothetical protein
MEAPRADASLADIDEFDATDPDWLQPGSADAKGKL